MKLFMKEESGVFRVCVELKKSFSRKRKRSHGEFVNDYLFASGEFFEGQVSIHTEDFDVYLQKLSGNNLGGRKSFC
jgi:hypothetical protein